MAWDCDKGGPGQNCFNKRMRLKFAAFAPALPGLNQFTDLDAAIMINGRILVQEWKRPGCSVPPKQADLFRELSRRGIVVAVVQGDAEAMTIESVAWWVDGSVSDRVQMGIGEFNAQLKRWCDGGDPR